jgi:antitoxin VapB
MALNIRNPEAEQLAEKPATLTGETQTQAVTKALRDRLDRLQRRPSGRCLADDLDEIALHCAALPELDSRSAEEIVGYDDWGIPE